MSKADKNEFKILAEKCNSNRKNVSATQPHKQIDCLQAEISTQTSNFYEMKNNLTNMFNLITEERKYNLISKE